MIRQKITTIKEVHLKEWLSWRKADGTICDLKRFHSELGFFVTEKDGECYVIINVTRNIPAKEGFMYAITEKFDELEGEEIDAGGDASEKEE